jgi:hypothetical protein
MKSHRSQYQEHMNLNAKQTMYNTIPLLKKCLDEFSDKGNTKMIIGGSFGLSLYTNHKKQNKDHDDSHMWNDIDIIVPVFKNTGSYVDCDKIDLLEEARLIKSIYNSDIEIRHTSSENFYNEKGEHISVVTGEVGKEDFDTMIVGTVNTKYDGKKLQFVFFNIYKDNLIDYYSHVSDLPVFSIVEKTIDNEVSTSKSYHVDEKFYIKSEADANDAKNGILNTLRHEFRRDKYKKKGFICNVPKF